MKICNFTQSELDLFRDECNFTDIESKCFELKAKDYTDVQLAMDLNLSEATIAVTMRRIRSKITTVLKQKAIHLNDVPTVLSQFVVLHTMAEWSRIPDFLSSKGVIYVFSDYRTENGMNIPRLKVGDGVSPLSELPFATMSITDDDMEYWDNKPDTENNDFGKVILIDETYSDEDVFTFPTDGYVMLEFDFPKDFASVNIYGSSGKTGFIFEKRPDIDIHSKEVFVRKGMRCMYLEASKGAKIKFIPLV